MRAFAARLVPFAPVLLRLVLAALFAVYGIERLLPGKFQPFADQVGTWNLPGWTAKALAWGTAVGGVLLAVGLLARLAVVALGAAAVLVAIKLKLWHGPFHGGADLPLLEVAGCLSILLSGAGRFSIDHKLFGGVGDDGDGGA